MRFNTPMFLDTPVDDLVTEKLNFGMILLLVVA